VREGVYVVAEATTHKARANKKPARSQRASKTGTAMPCPYKGGEQKDDDVELFRLRRWGGI
jgi:hypothetical protein